MSSLKVEPSEGKAGKAVKDGLDKSSFLNVDQTHAGVKSNQVKPNEVKPNEVKESKVDVHSKTRMTDG